MPQLNPDPWFFILFMSWFVYLIILMPKTNNLKTSNEPTMQQNQNKPEPLIWPWT
uniref:ATP synthase complex subunit 8 n=1 Tax=Gyrinophilus porphyriticus TaxID=134760 RepID=Q644H4_9SALA|nr:ATP synthase F0 subunit 8 [Gyrinophilus porphyriticus]AAU20660.1 ATP synthase F0 subunit 8 [Gyrinophilus porphyriticus]